VSRDRHVIFSVLMRGQPDVAATLSNDFISKLPKGLNDFLPRLVPWGLHSANTSS
jgi:hypothetical protein